MGSKNVLSSEKSPHSLSTPILKEQDFASSPFPRAATPPFAQTQHYDSDTTATNSSDEFDWDEDEGKEDASDLIKARRVRWLWLQFMKLSRFIRVLLVGVTGAAILIIPLLVVNLRFRKSPVRLQVHVWSLWLTIIWSAACATSLVVDATPHIVLLVIRLFGGQVERLKSQIEVDDWQIYRMH